MFQKNSPEGQWASVIQCAAVRCGDGGTLPRTLDPCLSAEGSETSGWYTGSPRESCSLGWDSLSSEAARIAIPKERKRVHCISCLAEGIFPTISLNSINICLAYLVGEATH